MLHHYNLELYTPRLSNQCFSALSGFHTELLPEQILVWREFKRTTVRELIQEATGHAPDIEEQEYLCHLGDTENEVVTEESEYHTSEIQQWLEGVGLHDTLGWYRDAAWLWDATVVENSLDPASEPRVTLTQQKAPDPQALTGVWEEVRQRALRITQSQ
jgi:hypothetical protein